MTLEKVFTRNGLVHDQAGAEVTLPDPLPTDPVLPPAAPPWTRAEIGEPEAVVTAVVAAAERMYGGTEDVPAAVEWLLEEDSAFGEPYETTGEFLSDLADSVAHQGTCTDDTAAAIPFMAELICDEGIPTGTRVILLGELLSLAVASPSSAVHLADRIAALGGEWAEPSANGLTRRAIARELPRLLSRWDEESDAARFVLAALTAACGSGTAQSRPELNTLPAPTATGRADAIALVRALLNEAPTKTALNRLSSSHPGITEHLDSPHMSARDLARAVLPDLVMRDIGPAITPGGSDHAGLARPGAAPRGVAVGRFPT
ncbi:hypothetical protein [Streptomyces sp. NPDC088725]|uniref:hypothetical protein n=1 Tax=Streptomyces sp. NPDC088725 TaxID=3365873 RepID=UPI003811D79E